MSPPSADPRLCSLVAQLLACESATPASSHSQAAPLPPVVRVFEKLRRSFGRLVGAAGFHVLLTRALTLARSRHPLLSRVEIRQDGTLDGFGTFNGSETAEAGPLLLAELLGLLVIFIGETLTTHLLRDIWPDWQQDGTTGEKAKET